MRLEIILTASVITAIALVRDLGCNCAPKEKNDNGLSYDVLATITVCALAIAVTCVEIIAKGSNRN